MDRFTAAHDRATGPSWRVRAWISIVPDQHGSVMLDANRSFPPFAGHRGRQDRGWEHHTRRSFDCSTIGVTTRCNRATSHLVSAACTCSFRCTAAKLSGSISISSNRPNDGPSVQRTAPEIVGPVGNLTVRLSPTNGNIPCVAAPRPSFEILRMTMSCPLILPPSIRASIILGWRRSRSRHDASANDPDISDILQPSDFPSLIQ